MERNKKIRRNYYNVNESLIPYRKFSKWGYCDPEGVIVIQPNYSCVDFFDEGFAEVGRYVELENGSIEKRYGLIDEKGKEIIPILYSEIIRSSFGGFIVRCISKNDTDPPEFRCFDSLGKEYPILTDLRAEKSAQVENFNYRYKKIFRFNHDFFIGCKFIDGKNYISDLELLDNKGEKVDLVNYGIRVWKEVILQMGYWTGIRKWSRINGKVGLFDDDGFLKIPFIYDSLSKFRNGLAIAKLDEKLGIIDVSNKVIVEFEFDELVRFEKDLTIWQGIRGGVSEFFTIENGFVNQFESIFTELDPIYRKAELINIDWEDEENFTLVNNEGKVIFSIENNDDKKPEVCGDLAIIPIGDKWTIIDHFGKIMFSKKYDDISHLGSSFFYFSDYEEDYSGIINSKGEEVYRINPFTYERKWIHGEMYVYNHELKFLSSSKLQVIEISYQVFPSKVHYIVGYVTNKGLECWKGELNYESLYTQFPEEVDLDDFEEDIKSYNSDEYFEGSYCPACGGREYMCCNYWIERNS